MFGSGGVGKSSLTIKMVTGNFLEEYDPTIEDSYRIQTSLCDQPVLFDILDTAGREEFSSMLDQWIREAQILMLCFSITSKSSWDDAEFYRRRAYFTKSDDKDWAMVLVSTKGDLEKYREVPRDDILEKAKEWDIPYVETSAKDNINVQFAYFQCIYAYWEQHHASCTSTRL